MARQYGVYPVVHPLRLDYMGLKKRLGEVPSPHTRKAVSPAFVEMVSAQPAAFEACIIEFESFRGAKVRIHWRTATPPDWANLLRAWRESER